MREPLKVSDKGFVPSVAEPVSAFNENKGASTA